MMTKRPSRKMLAESLEADRSLKLKTTQNALEGLLEIEDFHGKTV